MHEDRTSITFKKNNRLAFSVKLNLLGRTWVNMVVKGKKQAKKNDREGYGIKKMGGTYFYNSARHALHPWATNYFVWGGIRWNRLQQCLGFHMASHFKLGKKVKQAILAAETGWDVVKLLHEQQIPTDADWSGWGKWKAANLLPILRQMAKESKRFHDQLMEIEEPRISLCTQDKSLGCGLAALPNKKQAHLCDPDKWQGRNFLGRELAQVRAELRLLEEDTDVDEEDEDEEKENHDPEDDGDDPAQGGSTGTQIL